MATDNNNGFRIAVLVLLAIIAIALVWNGCKTSSAIEDSVPDVPRGSDRGV
jgi:PBP1b-binding outer membrane lipoprotein LpoB